MANTRNTCFNNKPGTVFKAPWQGIVSGQPENSLPPSATPNCCNWMIHDGELLTFPRWTPVITAPNGTNVSNVTSGNPGLFCSIIRALFGFENNQGLYSTGIISPDEDGLWILNQDGTTWFNIPPDTTIPPQPAFAAISDTTFPFPTQAYTSQLYFSRYLDGLLWQLNTSTISTTSLTSIGNISYTNSASPPVTNAATFGCRYLAELNSHLIAAYIYEPDDSTASGGNNLFTYPYRIRWSGENATSWDPNPNAASATPPNVYDPSAGFEDLIDVTDEICGIFTAGRTMLIFRTNGISEMMSGSGIVTFVFNHDWAAQRGIGAGFYNWCLANYGLLLGFVSHDNVYLYSGSGAGGGQLTPIGNSIATTNNPFGVSIYDDLNINPVTNKPVGFFVPKLKNNFVNLYYVISIPTSDNTKGCIQWWYDVNGQNWVRRVLVSAYHTERGLNVFTGTPLL